MHALHPRSPIAPYGRQTGEVPTKASITETYTGEPFTGFTRLLSGVNAADDLWQGERVERMANGRPPCAPGPRAC
jgi:hypothetical protein